jgi:hypothetical protein
MQGRIIDVLLITLDICVNVSTHQYFTLAMIHWHDNLFPTLYRIDSTAAYYIGIGLQQLPE